MTVFLQFVSDNAPYIYGLCALIALYLIRVAILARRERRAAIFPLEKEVALGRIYRTFSIAVLLLAIMGATWAAGKYLLPRIQQIEPGSTPAPDLLVLIDTPSPTPPPPTATPTVTPTPRPRPTRRPPPPPTQNTSAPAVQAPQCPNPGAAIASPGNGQIAEGGLAVTGTASIPNFQFFKLEYAWEGNPNAWTWFAGSETPVVGGVMGEFKPAGLPPGNYRVRLVVVDNTGNYPEPCSIQIVVP